MLRCGKLRKNISARKFEKMSDLDLTQLGTTYDYHSIMHSLWNEFAIDQTKPTIKIRQSGIDSKILGTGDGLSSIDIIEINRLYECGKLTGTSMSYEERSKNSTN